MPNAGTLRFYRRLLRTMMKTFDGDYIMFHRVRLEARRKIIENKSLEDPVQIQEKIFYGEECRDFLEKGLLQAKLTEKGNYRVKPSKEHTMGASIKPKPN